jgi:hypothetical protein
MDNFAKFARFVLLVPSIAAAAGINEVDTPARQLISADVVGLPVITITTGNPIFILPHCLFIAYCLTRN